MIIPITFDINLASFYELTGWYVWLSVKHELNDVISNETWAYIYGSYSSDIITETEVIKTL